MKFIHTADWQLGMTRHFLSGEAQARFSQARLDAVRSIGQLAVKEECEFVVVCGDVFESNQIDRQVLTRAFDAMSATPDVTFYLLPGNHDPLNAASIYTSNSFRRRRPANIVVLDGSEPVEVAAGVELLAAPWTSKRPLVDLVDRAAGLVGPSDVLRIAVGHGALDSRSPDATNPALISLSGLEERIRNGEIHYVALGDRHSTTEEGESGRIWYSGAPEPTRYDEIEPGNVLVVSLENDRLEVTPQTIGTWAFSEREWQVVSNGDIDGLEEWLSSFGHPERKIVKLSLVGQLTVAQKARLDDLLELQAESFAALEHSELHTNLAVIADDADFDDLDLSEVARFALSDLRKQANSGNEAAALAATDALALLHRLSEAAT
ncbi:MAG: DNA repair exonuclease [Acidimicrobiales bacterium]|nr:DNA repair exonuclease [Acidimicrobiaceae bacterium]MXY01735.1 DNA repair exonuclease [Acidimicrobiales bacterium]MYA26480.1 DNA repair exonuclease [Acidimicrobiales bacterium]MYD84572.1 DNA repair exonuclease [Acidimicrobiales bacterium]MYG88410.1 DNA repair exonuclease [Acidimicrobiales bacterium]